jgi:hypothetical protein
LNETSRITVKRSLSLVMMCLWRMTAFSRLLLLHVALSSLSYQPNRQHNHVNAHSQFGLTSKKRNGYVPLGRLSLPQMSSSTIPTFVQDMFLDVWNRSKLLQTVSLRRQQQQQQQPQNHRRSSPSPTSEPDNCIRYRDVARRLMATSTKTSPTTNIDSEKDCDIDCTGETTKTYSYDYNDDPDVFYIDSNSKNNMNGEYTTISSSTRRRTIWFTDTTYSEDDDRYYNEELRCKQNEDLRTNNISSMQTTTEPLITTVEEVVRIRIHRPLKSSSTATKEATTGNDEQLHIESLTQPLIMESVWNQLTGTEWCNPCDGKEERYLHTQLLDSLARMGEEVARVDTPTHWIDWRPYGTATTNANGDSNIDILMDGNIYVWTGKCLATPNQQSGEDRYLGVQLPFIKTRAILPHTINDMVDLLVDSKKVVTYNPWSLGRIDCWIDTRANCHNQNTNDHTPGMITKIVQNRVQPPIPGARPVISTTLLHARPIETKTSSMTGCNTKSWILVSRSIGNNHTYIESDCKASSRSDILLGINLIEPVISKNGDIDSNSCMITSVAHVYSPSVPVAFAERLGVQSAIKFIQDLRNLKLPATASKSATATTTAVN